MSETPIDKKPIVYTSTHRVQFSELDPYNHVRTAVYAAYYVDHRMKCLRENVGWDLRTLGTLPFMLWVKRLEIDYVRPAVGDQELTITSFVREFRGHDAYVECAIADEAGKTISRALMITTYVDKQTNRATDWTPETMNLFFERGEP